MLDGGSTDDTKSQPTLWRADVSVPVRCLWFLNHLVARVLCLVSQAIGGVRLLRDLLSTDVQALRASKYALSLDRARIVGSL